MPNRIIEIHDSVNTSVSFSQGRADLTFSSAYIHQSEGIPGQDAGSGWIQRAILRIHDAEVKGAFSEFPADLSDGRILMGEQQFENEIPIPPLYKGAFELCLERKWQPGEVCFTGSGAELELLGQPEYVEEFPGPE
jgi:hypothetical protein